MNTCSNLNQLIRVIVCVSNSGDLNKWGINFNIKIHFSATRSSIQMKYDKKKYIVGIKYMTYIKL